MCERGLTRLGASAVVAVLTLAVCVAGGVSMATARSCRTRCRQLSGVGAEPPSQRQLALRQGTAYMEGGFVSVRLHCRRTHQACRGVIRLTPRGAGSPRLARAHFRIPARRTRRVELRLTSEGSAYLEAHERVRAVLRAREARGSVDSFGVTIIG